MPAKLAEDRPRNSRRRTPGVRVNAYYGSSKNSQDEVPERRKVNWKKKMAAITLDSLSILILLGFLIYCLYVSPHSKIKVDNETYHKTSDYQKLVNEELGKFKNRNKITFDEAGVKNKIKSAFPEVESVNIELPVFGAEPVVSLSVGAPAFTLQSNGKSYLVSANGTAVGEVQNYGINKNLPKIADQSGYKVQSGRQILSIKDITFIETLQAQLQRKKVPIKQFVLPPSPEEVDLYTLNEAFYTKFFLGGDANLQAGQYLAARNNWGDAKPSSYLDVRVAGKIFYK